MPSKKVKAKEFGFMIGVGKVDILGNPDPLPAVQRGAPTGVPADCIQLPLFAKACVISNGKQTAAIVTLDISNYRSPLVDKAIANIARETGIPYDNITITCSHTHSAPIYTYFKETLTGLTTEAVKIALKNMTPCKIGAANTEVTGVTHNRRIIWKGDVWNSWLLPDPEIYARHFFPAAGPIDTDLQLLAATGADGKFKAVLWSYSSHAISNPSNELSPDFPGYVQEYVKEKLGYDVMTFFFPGPCGDVNATNFPKKIAEMLNAMRPGDLVGPLYGEGVLRCLKKIKYADNSRMHIDHRTIRIPAREEQVFWEEDVRLKWPRRFEDYKRNFENTSKIIPESFETNLTGISFGDEFAIVTVPCELFVSFGIKIKKKSPFKHTLVAEQTNGALGYIPTIKDFELKGYETWFGEHSKLSIHAGDIMKDEALDILKNLKQL